MGGGGEVSIFSDSSPPDVWTENIFEEIGFIENNTVSHSCKSKLFVNAKQIN